MAKNKTDIKLSDIFSGQPQKLTYCQTEKIEDTKEAKTNRITAK